MTMIPGRSWSRPTLVLWLVASVGCGAGTDDSGTASVEPPQAPPWFEEAAVERGIRFEHRSGHAERYLLPEIMGGGGALFDMDRDGDLDAYLVQSGSLVESGAAGPPNQLFRNRGDGTFEDVTTDSGAGDTGYGQGVAAGDYDGDGDVDLYVTNVGANRLLRNEGGGRFSDRTEQAGVGHPGWGTSALFFDFDRDGDLDIFAANYIRWSLATEQDCWTPQGQADYCSPRSYHAPDKDVLYRNDGDGTFTDVTDAMGVNAAFGNGLGVVSGDFNGDGWLDVFVANDGTLNQLWINQAGAGFEDRALIAGCASDQEGLAKAGMGVTAGDLDDDGDLDIMVCNLFRESDSYFRNDGEYFTDVTSLAGLGVASRQFTRFGLGWVDLNNDGYLDLFEANGRVYIPAVAQTADVFAEINLLFVGGADNRFDEVLPRGGTEPPLVFTSRAAVFGDVDNDGAVDILVVNRDAPASLLINRAAADAGWLLLDVINRNGSPAEGAVVMLSVGDRLLRRDVRSGYSYQASNDPRVHVGLGSHAEAGDVTVRWVDGTAESFGSLTANQRVTLQRGAGREQPPAR